MTDQVQFLPTIVFFLYKNNATVNSDLVLLLLNKSDETKVIGTKQQKLLLQCNKTKIITTKQQCNIDPDKRSQFLESYCIYFLRLTSSHSLRKCLHDFIAFNPYTLIFLLYFSCNLVCLINLF